MLAGCDAAGISRATFFRWRSEDQSFADAVRDADDGLTDRLVACLHSRALSGSDRLLLAALRARLPDVYGERRSVEVSGGIGVAVADLTPERLQGMSDAEISELRRMLRKLKGEPVERAAIPAEVLPG